MTEYSDTELMRLVGRRNMAVRWGKPDADELERQVVAMTAQRDLSRLAERLSVLPADDRRELAASFTADLGLTAA